MESFRNVSQNSGKIMSKTVFQKDVLKWESELEEGNSSRKSRKV